MDRNQQLHSPALLPLTKAGELNLKDVLRKRGPKSHLHPETAVSDGLQEMAESQQENASKKCRYFDYLTYFSLDYFFPTPVREKERMEGCQTLWPKISILNGEYHSSAHFSTVEFTKMWGKNWSTKRINSWNLVIMNFAHIVRNTLFSASSFKLCFPNIIWLITVWFVCQKIIHSKKNPLSIRLIIASIQHLTRFNMDKQYRHKKLFFLGLRVNNGLNTNSYLNVTQQTVTQIAKLMATE